METPTGQPLLNAVEVHSIPGLYVHQNASSCTRETPVFPVGTLGVGPPGFPRAINAPTVHGFQGSRTCHATFGIPSSVHAPTLGLSGLPVTPNRTQGLSGLPLTPNRTQGLPGLTVTPNRTQGLSGLPVTPNTQPRPVNIPAGRNCLPYGFSGCPTDHTSSDHRCNRPVDFQEQLDSLLEKIDMVTKDNALLEKQLEGAFSRLDELRVESSALRQAICGLAV